MRGLSLRSLQLLAGVSLLLAMGSLCALPDDAVYGRACESDSDCGAEHLCVVGRCALEHEAEPAEDAGERLDAGRGPSDGGGGLDADSGPLSDGGEPPLRDAGQDLCTSAADCDDGLYCNGVEGCVSGQCQAGTSPCGGSTPVCNEASDTCQVCTNNSHCDDGDPCNGAETCSGGVCQAGMPYCDGGMHCATDPLRCVECRNDDDCATGVCVGEQCVECRNDSQCDDGLFCNGAETCDTSENICMSGALPCGGLSPICLEANDTCVQCTSNAHCSDGIYCNGAETCNTTTNTCVSGALPCGPGELCRENGLPRCGRCFSDNDCRGGEYCGPGNKCCPEGTYCQID